MNKNELLKLLILLARYVEIYHESASDDDMNMLSDAYTVVQNKLLGCVDRTMTPVELFDIVDAQCKVAQEGVNIVALEDNNKRLRKLADAVLVFAEEFGLDSWVVDDEAEGRTGTPELKLDAAITEYKEAKR